MKRLLGLLEEGMTRFSVLAFAQWSAAICTTWMINNPRI